MREFDYIVVAAVHPARLWRRGCRKIRPIGCCWWKAARRTRTGFIHIPATFFKVIEKGRDVHFYTSEPDAGLNGKQNVVPQGNVLGGGSSINAMIYVRGQRQDYDSWAQMGCRAWSYDKVLPVFRDLEGNQRLSGRISWRGRSIESL